MMTLAELAQRTGAQLRGDPDKTIDSCASLDVAKPNQLAFVANPRYESLLAASSAACVVVSPQLAERHPGRAVLIADDPYFAFRQAMVALHGFRPAPEVGISTQAYVDETAEVGDLCTIRPGAYVAPHAKIGDRVVLYPNVYVGKGAIIGNDVTLHPGVCVYDRCVLGDRVTLHANTVIGQDGLGYATAQAPRDAEVKHHKLPHAGNAVIEDDVEMGACCAIDRATLGSTVVGKGSKFSDHVVIGHGATIGKHNLIVAHTGVAGSTTTGDYVVMGGHVGIAGHLRIGHHVEIAADSKVMTDIPDHQQWGGTPASPLTDAKRIVLAQKRLPELMARLKKLEHRLAALEK